MKSAVVMVFSSMIIVLLAVPSFGMESATEMIRGQESLSAEGSADNPETEAVEAAEVNGQVVSIDTEKGIITVKGDVEEVTVLVDDETVITAGGESRSLQDIAPGSAVSVKYVTEDGTKVAVSITIN